jgi:hypothetical protein
MQASFSDLEYAAKKRVTRRDRSLSEIEAVTPWLTLVAEIEPFYPKGEGRGRPLSVCIGCCACTSPNNALGFPTKALKMPLIGYAERELDKLSRQEWGLWISYQERP